MTIFYLLLALAVAVGLNHPSRLWRVMAQLVAVSALGLMAWSIWLANADGTFAARPAADLRPLLLNAMAGVALFVILFLLALAPTQWARRIDPVPDWNQRQRWGTITRLLHWTSVVLMLAALPMGLFVMVLAQSPERREYLNDHIGIGVAVFVLLVARLLVLRASPGPASPNGAARLNKLALYLLLATLPVSGLLVAAATGAPVLGLHAAEAVPLPLARLLHQWLSGLFALAFAAHAGAALWHHFALRDRQLIRRMLR